MGMNPRPPGFLSPIVRMESVVNRVLDELNMVSGLHIPEAHLCGTAVHAEPYQPWRMSPQADP